MDGDVRAAVPGDVTVDRVLATSDDHIAAVGAAGGCRAVVIVRPPRLPESCAEVKAVQSVCLASYNAQFKYLFCFHVQLTSTAFGSKCTRRHGWTQTEMAAQCLHDEIEIELFHGTEGALPIPAVPVEDLWLQPNEKRSRSNDWSSPMRSRPSSVVAMAARRLSGMTSGQSILVAGDCVYYQAA